jgi:hypothetical protein
MSFHGQRLRQLRAMAHLEPTPDDIYLPTVVEAFWWESIDPRFYSPAARYWYDQVADYAANSGQIPASERKAFKLVGDVLRMARDERDERKRRAFFMPSANAQRDFDAARLHRDAEAIKASLLEKEMRRLGFRYGPDYELPDGIEPPSANGLFDRAMAAEYGKTEGAVKQRRMHWRRKHAEMVRASV